MNDKSKIKALVFDMGGVLIDLDIQKCIMAFKDNLSYDGISMLLGASHQKGMYSDLEEGKISADEFRSFILSGSAPGCTAGDVDRSMWALLEGMQPYKADLLRRLSSEYDLYLLSNTNSISMERCLAIFDEAGIPMKSVFRKLFLSYQMKMQKPSESIFRTVIEEIGLPAGNMLFIDDSASNVLAAEKTGFNTLLYVQGSDLSTALENRLEELGRC